MMDSKHVLEKAICGALTYGDTQYIVINSKHELMVDPVKPVGEIFVMDISFTKDEIKDYLQKVAPEAVADVENGTWGTELYVLAHMDDDTTTKYAEVEPGEMIRLQCRLDDRIAEIRQAWGF